MDTSHFFAYLSRMRYIGRWNIMRNTEHENILEHSAQCAMIAHALCIIRNRLYGGSVNPEAVALAALYHESSEVITGDLATPVKYYNPEISAAYKKIEALAENRLCEMLPPELRADYAPLLMPPTGTDEQRIIKYADKLCAYIKCMEELKAGNCEFERAAAKIKTELETIEASAPEVAYFMKTFLPSFSLTLDELN